MATHLINGALVNCPNIYRFGGYVFEFHHYLGPSLCRKDREISKRQPGPKSRFWPVLKRWQRLNKAAKRKTLIYS